MPSRVGRRRGPAQRPGGHLPRASSCHEPDPTRRAGHQVDAHPYSLLAAGWGPVGGPASHASGHGRRPAPDDRQEKWSRARSPPSFVQAARPWKGVSRSRIACIGPDRRIRPERSRSLQNGRVGPERPSLPGPRRPDRNGSAMNASWTADQTAFRCRLGTDHEALVRKPFRGNRPGISACRGPADGARLTPSAGSGPAIGQLRVVPSGDTNDPSD